MKKLPPLFFLFALAGLALGLGGCATARVQPWQRAALADPP